MLTRRFGNTSPVKGLIRVVGPDSASMYGPTLHKPVAKRCYSKLSASDKVICVGGASAQSSMLEAIQANRVDPSMCVSIGRRSWVRDSHSDWDDRPWGQCKGYLPPVMREIADEKYPNYPENALLTFGMMKTINAELERRMIEFGVVRFGEELDYFKQRPDGSLVGIHDGTEHVFTDSENFRLINASIEHISPSEIESKHSGLLYKMSKANSTSNVALVGSGANLTWTCRDTPERNIVHLIPPNDRIRTDLFDIVHCSMMLADCSFDKSEQGYVTIEGPDLRSNRPMVVRVAEEMVFSAMGYKFNHDLVSQIDTKKVVNVQMGPKSSDLRLSYQFFGGVASYKAHDLRGTRMPPGNLKLNYLKIQHAMGDFNPSARNAVLLFDAWKEVIVDSAIAHNIIIDDRFFDLLEPVVKHAYTSNIPSEQQVFTTVNICYRKACIEGHAAMRDGQKMSSEDFMKFIREPTNEVLEKIDTPREDNKRNDTPSM